MRDARVSGHLLFAGILIARLLAAFLFFPELPSVFFREALAELLIVGLLAIGIYRSKKRKH